MVKDLSSHLKAVLQALLVTFLWSTSWVLIKFGLIDIPALTFAGLRYSLAFLCLLTFALRQTRLSALRRLTLQDWLFLAGFGLIYYTITQGAQFLGLTYLPAATVNLLLSFTSVIVSFAGLFLLAEVPTRNQWGGVGLYLLGTLTYFFPADFSSRQFFGLLAVIIGLLANAASAILGRKVNRSGDLHPLIVTLVSMGAGSTALLIVGIGVQGFPPLSLFNWIVIGWLAVINTAFAFTIWNHTLYTLSALESSLINNAMLIQIPALAWIFLGEVISWRGIAGLLIALTGIILAQLRGRH